MSIWKTKIDPNIINQFHNKTAMKVLGIEITEMADDCLKGKMPVDSRTHQPMGVLHGGASVLFAETLGSCAASFVAGEKFICLGQEVNANHIRSVKEGWVYGKAKPLHIGRSSHVWSIEISNEDGKLVCISRITMAIIPNPEGINSYIGS